MPVAELDEAAGRRALLTDAQQRIVAKIAARLVPGDAEAQAGGKRIVLRADVVAPVAVALLGPAGVHGMVAGVGQAELAACLDDPVEDVDRELGGDIELPAQLADIGDAGGTDPRVADLELARRAEREGQVGKVLARELREQLAILDRLGEAEAAIEINAAVEILNLRLREPTSPQEIQEMQRRYLSD